MRPDPGSPWRDDGEAGDPAALRRALGLFATGVTVVTTLTDDGRPVGITASSFNTVSLDPALVLWSLSRRSPHAGSFRPGRPFGVNVLAGDQTSLCQRFGQPGADKFAGLVTTPGVGGVPMLPGAAAQFECVGFAEHPGGDHVIVVGQVLRLRWRDTAPMVFCRGRLGVLPEAEPLAA